MQVLNGFRNSGGEPNVSDAITINGQPGDFYNCSKSGDTIKLVTIFTDFNNNKINLEYKCNSLIVLFAGTFKLIVDQNKTYLLRMVNAAMNLVLFVSIAKHNLTIVGADASYTKPLTAEYITIAPGQTMDALLTTDQNPGLYYMAARAYSSGVNVSFDNTTTTAILQYKANDNSNVSYPQSTPPFPYLPYYNDTTSAFNFITRLRSLANEDHPIDVPLNITTKIVSTVSINTFPCPKNRSCQGPNGSRFSASMNNISFVTPSIDILEAYYFHINGVPTKDFPSFPPFLFNFTAQYMPLELELPKRGTTVKVLDYGSTVEVVFQGTNLVAGIEHPMHLHGYSFYVVGYGFGNFDEERDKLRYNLVDPPLLNTVNVPKNGWTTVRFSANNPGNL